MLSAQFVEVGSGNVDLALPDATNMSGQPSYDENGDAQTTLRLFTGTGYRYYSWSGNLTTENPDMAEELEDELGVDASTLNNQWLDGDYEISQAPLSVADGFWLYAKNAGTITLSGQVYEGDTATFDLVAGLNMVSSPWPMDLPLSSITVTGQPSYDENGDAQASLRIYTGTGYRYYSWSGNLTTENPDMAEELEDELGVDASTLNNKWLDGDYEDSGTAAIGTSFWIYAKNPGTVTFTKPQ